MRRVVGRGRVGKSRWQGIVVGIGLGMAAEGIVAVVVGVGIAVRGRAGAWSAVGRRSSLDWLVVGIAGFVEGSSVGCIGSAGRTIRGSSPAGGPRCGSSSCPPCWCLGRTGVVVRARVEGILVVARVLQFGRWVWQVGEYSVREHLGCEI